MEAVLHFFAVILDVPGSSYRNEKGGVGGGFRREQDAGGCHRQPIDCAGKWEPRLKNGFGACGLSWIRDRRADRESCGGRGDGRTGGRGWPNADKHAVCAETLGTLLHDDIVECRGYCDSGRERARDFDSPGARCIFYAGCRFSRESCSGGPITSHTCMYDVDVPRLVARRLGSRATAAKASDIPCQPQREIFPGLFLFSPVRPWPRLHAILNPIITVFHCCQPKGNHNPQNATVIPSLKREGKKKIPKTMASHENNR